MRVSLLGGFVKQILLGQWGLGLFLIFSTSFTAAEPFILPEDQQLAPLRFEDLLALSKKPEASSQFQETIDRSLSTFELSNQAWRDGYRPSKSTYEVLEDSIGVATWNIEKSLTVKDKLVPALSSEKEFLRQLEEAGASSKEKQYALEQYSLFKASDVVILQEQDVRVKRSGYIHSAKEIAKELGMNYAYGPSQIEIDPAIFESGVDPDRYQGFFGSAILSRYPIKRVRLKQLDTQAYDWNAGEREKLTAVEKLKRWGAKVVLDEESKREIKVGGRNLLIADLHVPGLPNDTLTVVNVHLEIKATPEAREAQLREILNEIKNIKNPVVLAGDFNASSTDISPTNIPRIAKRYATDPDNTISHATNLASAAGVSMIGNLHLGVANTIRNVVNTGKNLHNPAAADIPLVLPNPRRALIDAIKDFRFEDGSCFDFRGDPLRSYQGKSLRDDKPTQFKPRIGFNKGMISKRIPKEKQRSEDIEMGNSNNRTGLGRFVTSFETDKTYGAIGKDRLDFMFVSSGLLKDCENQENQPYKLAPHNGRTLKDFNRAGRKEALSDHDPLHVAIPINEPYKLNEQVREHNDRKTVLDWWQERKEEKKAHENEIASAQTKKGFFRKILTEQSSHTKVKKTQPYFKRFKK